MVHSTMVHTMVHGHLFREDKLDRAYRGNGQMKEVIEGKMVGKRGSGRKCNWYD